MSNRFQYVMYGAAIIAGALGYSIIAIVVFVGAVIVHHQLHIVRQMQQQEQLRQVSSPQKVEEEFSFALPVAAGWDRIAIVPAKKRLKTSECYGGLFPPVTENVYDYDVRTGRDNMVFIRLVESRTEYIDKVDYEVFNRTVQEEVIKRNHKDPCPPTDYRSARLWVKQWKRDTVWHELIGPERYFILLKHGTERSFLIRERNRLQEGLAKFKAKAEKVGAIALECEGPISYGAPEDATDEQKESTRQGVLRLLNNLKRSDLSVSDYEVLHQNRFKRVLDELLSGSEAQEHVRS